MTVAKTKKGITGAVAKIAKKYVKLHEVAQGKLAKAVEGDRMNHWLQWESLSYLRTEGLSGEWTVILTYVNRVFNEEGATPDDVLKTLQGYRDGLVEQVMRTDQTNHSTSVMANAIDSEKVQTLRYVAGVNILDGDSLAGLLISCGVGL